MRVHSVEKINLLKRLRKKGYSINELVDALSIPKTTVWHHIHKVLLSPKYAMILESKRGGSAKRTQRKWLIAKENAHQLLCGSNREHVLILAMLYWAEGTKRVCDFINSDGRMIKLYLGILRTVLKIPEINIKPTIRFFSNTEKEECLKYWSMVTGIAKNRFAIRMNDGGTRGRTKYGMCRISLIKGKGSETLKLLHSLIDQSYESIVKKLGFMSP